MILATTKQSLQDQKTSGIVVNSENTHSSGKLVNWVIESRFNRHRLRLEEARSWIGGRIWMRLGKTQMK